VANKIVLQQQLLTEDKAEVGLREQLVQEGVILAHKLILDILKDRPDISEGENVVATFILNNLVVSVVEG
jgi:hypothetical protein